jgi:L-lysine 2,3-aminomutase
MISWVSTSEAVLMTYDQRKKELVEENERESYEKIAELVRVKVPNYYISLLFVHADTRHTNQEFELALPY